jgi:hypothetical protein
LFKNLLLCGLVTSILIAITAWVGGNGINNKQLVVADKKCFCQVSRAGQIRVRRKVFKCVLPGRQPMGATFLAFHNVRQYHFFPVSL